MRARLGMTVIGVGLLGGSSLPALAALGGDVSSVAADRVQMRAQLRGVTSGAGFTVHEIAAPSGTLVREYVAPSGTVFAVTWRGPSKPDLRDLFGSYFQQFVSASSMVRHGAATRRHFAVREPDLVVQSNGRM
ncbi:MAG: DUF2844 domain-containing protein, partial [Steroidobacteraceae bacterium]